jgi:hypothetical protein
MEEIGFEDVQETRLKLPLNTWLKDRRLKELGMWVSKDLMEFIPAVTKVFTAGLGWYIEEVNSFVERAKADLTNRHVHGWIDV